MKSLKKELFTITLLLVMAVVGIYVANAGTLDMPASSDTKSGHYPCSKPATSRKLCNTNDINCKAWAIYDACVDGSVYCD